MSANWNVSGDKAVADDGTGHGFMVVGSTAFEAFDKALAYAAARYPDRTYALKGPRLVGELYDYTVTLLPACEAQDA